MVKAPIQQIHGDSVLANMKSADGLFVVGYDQRVTHWSNSAQEILGFGPEDTLGMPCYEVVGGREENYRRFCRRNCPIASEAQRGRSTANYDLRVQTKDGADKWINISILLMGGRDERPGHILHLFRDVTQHRRMEKSALKALLTLQESLNPENGKAAESPVPMPTPRPRLTHREQQVLRLLSDGMRTPQIAQSLGVTPVTARNHVTNLLAKLGVDNRLQAVLYGLENHLI
ncbi:MAG: PAS domain-containing protein [Chloroflexi bacterium]|nr:PAS domain-containing protein [Chloroflexota bacterium]